MAKWGEGDPRWIVEERPDAVNVNNWHWTEKDASSWSKDKLRSLLLGLQVEEKEVACCAVTDITSMEGEASASNRKAKIILFYEWIVKLEWKGKLLNGKKSVKGNIEIPNLSEEQSLDDIVVQVTVEGTDSESTVLKEIMRNSGTEKIKAALSQYINDLNDEFTKGMILPSKHNQPPKKQDDAKMQNLKTKMNSLEVKKESTSGVKTETVKLEETESLKCTVDEAYRIFTEPELMTAFTKDRVTLDAKVGGKFELFGGSVSGKFLEIVPNQKIVQQWRFSSWPQDYYSTVTLTFEQTAEDTKVKLVQTGIPLRDEDKTREGWKWYYWNSIKRTFGFGATLL